MYKIICLAWITGFLLSGCTFKSTKQSPTKDTVKHTPDTSAYQMRAVKDVEPNCDTTKNKCTYMTISYPYFSDQPALNDSIERRIAKIYLAENPLSSLKELRSVFMKDYLLFKKEPYAEGRTYEFMNTTRVLTNRPALMTLQFESYTYTGGAHGGSLTTFINWDTKAKKSVLLDDILIPGYANSLNRIAENIFRKNEGITPTDDLKAYFFENNVFKLNTNYLLTDSGIKFMYNQYEIKPYAAGKTELFIPYTAIKSLLKPNTVIEN